MKKHVKIHPTYQLIKKTTGKRRIRNQINEWDYEIKYTDNYRINVNNNELRSRPLWQSTSHKWRNSYASFLMISFGRAMTASWTNSQAQWMKFYWNRLLKQQIFTSIYRTFAIYFVFPLFSILMLSYANLYPWLPISIDITFSLFGFLVLFFGLHNIDDKYFV